MDAKQNATQNAVESCCYLDKLVEIQHKLVTENLGMKIEIEELKRKEVDISHHKQVINENDEEIRCLEEKIMTDLSAKESELSIRSSKLEKVALQNNDCEKFKEDMIISYVDIQLKDCILSEIYSEVKMAQGFAEAEELYEVELTDEKLNATHQVVESFCYLDKFKEANDMMNKLLCENEAMKIEIAEMKRKEGIFENEMDISHQKQQMAMFAKEMELFIMLSKLQHLASQSFCMSTILDKFKEEITILYVDIQLRDLISSKSDAEVQMVQANATKAKQLYELEFTDTKLTAAHREVESFCYLDRFKKADVMINNLVFENEAMKTDISEMKRKEDVFINERDVLKDNYSVLMKVKQQEINEKDEELRCLEQKLVTDLYAKDMALFIVLSKLEQMASENYDFERENICMSRTLEKFVEEMIILYVDMQFKDCIFSEKDAEVGLLQREELRHLEQNHLTDLFSKDIELSILSSKLKQMEYELYENVVRSEVFEAQLMESVALISRERESLSSEILMLKKFVEDASRQKELTDEQWAKTKKTMEMEISELKTAFNETNSLLESLKKDLIRVVCERDELVGELLIANKEVEIAKALGDENGAIATKAKQARESIKLYAKEKEKEVKLLEKSVKELTHTMHVLENQVDLMKGDTEKQRLQQEEQKDALKSQNDHLNDKLIRAEAMVTRVRIELTKLRSANDC